MPPRGFLIFVRTSERPLLRLKISNAVLVSRQLRYDRIWSRLSRKGFTHQNLHSAAVQHWTMDK